MLDVESLKYLTPILALVVSVVSLAFTIISSRTKAAKTAMEKLEDRIKILEEKLRACETEKMDLLLRLTRQAT